MDKYKAVPVYFLKMLLKSMSERSAHYISLKYLVDERQNLPAEVIEGVTKKELVEDAMPDVGSGIDYALPQSVVDLVQEKMGYNMVPDYVMDCRGNYKLVPITKVGKAMLPVIYRVCFGTEVPE